MGKKASPTKQIKVVSNTHWDREFRHSFEKTRRHLMDMLDTTLDILESDPKYNSFTMDGHSIMIDDYLEMRPERREQVEKFIKQGRLVIGPYYTLAEEFSVGQEPIVRNLIYGRKTVRKYGGKTGTVAYTPSSWGQTGQLPQILRDFGLTHMMFYRGVSHHECDAEWIWEAPDGTRVMASRFAVYARYNWYYQVHRAVTTGRVFEKDYIWGEFDEAPFRPADGLSGEDLTFELKSPVNLYNPKRLKQAIEDMVEREGKHFTTEVFLAMNGHDISVAHPNESRVIEDAKKLFAGKYDIEHCSLEEFWTEAEKHIDKDKLPVLTGERRSYLKEGMWTFLFPNTISSRTYLKQEDFAATCNLVRTAEPLACLAIANGAEAPTRYLDRGWRYLLSNHTHDANGGCAPDAVCQDMEYRYRKASDIADIVASDALGYIALNLAPGKQSADVMQLIVYNPLPFKRDAIVAVDLEIPRTHGAKAARLVDQSGNEVAMQAISDEKSSSFVDSIWEVPRILESNRVRFYAKFDDLPGLGYRTYTIVPEKAELRDNDTLVTGPASMENDHLAVTVNGNGTIDILHKATAEMYNSVNYLRDQGEAGNAWKHVPPVFDQVFTSLGASATARIIENGPLVSAIAAEYEFEVPLDYADGARRSDTLVKLPVRVEYRLRAGESKVNVRIKIDNRAKDHWLRACVPTGITAEHTVSDSHFDAVIRPVKIPDSTGWVERAYGTHPMQTFAGVSDEHGGIAFMPRGLYEYEMFEDAESTLALTLIRACRIKLAVSEEKQTELPDDGIQCPGIRRFEYDICVHEGDWSQAGLFNEAACGYTPIRAAQIGRGKGTLPLEGGFASIDNSVVHISAIKPAESGKGVVMRLFNPSAKAQTPQIELSNAVVKACHCGMDETSGKAVPIKGGKIRVALEPHKIASVLLEVN